MPNVRRRGFLKTSAAGIGAAIAAGNDRLRAEPPIPLTGRAYRDVAGRRAELYALMGDLPDRQRPIGASKRGEEEREGYVLESWVLDLNGLEPVPASLARPRSPGRAAPAIVFNHS